MIGKIENGNAAVKFKDPPEGKYAVNIFRDEDNNAKIKKGSFYQKKKSCLGSESKSDYKKDQNLTSIREQLLYGYLRQIFQAYPTLY